MSSLRNGLPYGWWKSSGFWLNALALAVALAALAGLTLVLLAWWGLA